MRPSDPDFSCRDVAFAALGRAQARHGYPLTWDLIHHVAPPKVPEDGPDPARLARRFAEFRAAN